MDTTWPINEVCRLTGLTSRTLRHYDAIGLLSPARTEPGGRRRYDYPGLLRLQQILLLRELGLGLDAIRAALQDDGTLAVLRRHAAELNRERERLAVLARTVTETIDRIEKGRAMPVEQMFQGFENDPYEQEARERWGDAAVDASYDKIRAMTPEQAALAKDGFPRVHAALEALRATGAAPSDPAVQDVVAEHHRIVSLFWTPTAEAYRGLGRMYLDDERFRRNIGAAASDPAQADALVAFLRDAMDVYADTRLT